MKPPELRRPVRLATRPLEAEGSPLKLLLAVLGCLLLTGCTLSYESENGPRGPEKLDVGPPWATDCCNPNNGK